MNYKELEVYCHYISELNDAVTDQKVLSLMQEENPKLNRQLVKELKKYKSVLPSIPEEIIGYLIPDYYIYSAYKKGGYLKSYLSHPTLQNLTREEKAFLAITVEHPWSFSLCRSTKNEEENFFEMYDFFSDESYTLYSPGIQDIQNKELNNNLFLVLRSFNGKCWQTYGLIHYYQSFEPEDLIYFSKFMDSDIQTMRETSRLLHRNILPYYFLFAFSAVPMMVSSKGRYAVRRCYSKIKKIDLDVDACQENFFVESKQGIVQLKLKRWSKHPHFATMYYNKKKRIVEVSAMTLEGFEKISSHLSADETSLKPDYFGTMGMHVATKEILNKENSLAKYEKLFIQKSSPEVKEEMSRINEALGELIPFINSGKPFDIEKIATKYDVDVDALHDLVQKISAMIK